MIAKNPILRGFNPDPSIIRVGKDYYIATSTFEWFPGVQIHHSRDLVNWDLVTWPLNRTSQLDMLGAPDSCGVWAPCLTYDKGTFYLVYSNVKSFDGVWKDTPNYLVTTNDIWGDWSEPIFLSSSGFDGSFFHDDDGRKWYSSMITDHRKGKLFGGILLQEYDIKNQKLHDEIYTIFNGTELGITEAPHIYKRKDWYYLMTAEGGTEYGHAVTLARSKNIIGPYEVHPQNPIITTRNQPNAPLQKCGHADLVETPNGDCFAVFLVGRPLTTRGRCILGRETAIEAMEWREDDWLYLKNKTKSPRLELPIRFANSPTLKKAESKIDFNTSELDINFQSLRIPISEDWASLNFRKGYLRLFGRESLSSLFYQSLIARRIQHFHIEASTLVEFEPEHFQQMAGLLAYYNTGHWYYLNIIGGAMGKPSQKYLQITACDNFVTTDILENPIEITGQKQVLLKLTIQREKLQFFYAFHEADWKPIGQTLDSSILSDDYVREGSQQYRPAFTGAFVGLCCQDLAGTKKEADFAWFNYLENRAYP